MKFTLFSIFLLLSLTVMAVQIEVDEPQQKIEAAERYLVLTEAQWAYEQARIQSKQFLTQSITDLDKSMSEQAHQLLVQQRAEKLDVMERFLSWQNIQPQMIKLLTDTYSLEDLNAINVFYESEAGRNLVSKAPELTKAQVKMLHTMTQQMTQALAEVDVKHDSELQQYFSSQETLALE